MQQSLADAGLPQDAVQLVQTTDREAVGQLIAMPQYVDVIIPRGGKGFKYEAYRDGELAEINRRYYRIPAILPLAACPFCERLCGQARCAETGTPASQPSEAKEEP